VKAFEAKYYGTCHEDCRTSIQPGQKIRYERGLLVNAMGPDIEELEVTARVCGTCHMTVPCWCED
jgi:hypothetical protein